MVQYTSMDAALGAVADSTRRKVLERLGKGPASITELAESHEMTLTGMKKHVSILEETGLVRTEKVGRVRYCVLGSRRLDREAAWIRSYQQMLEAQLDSLEDYLERTKPDTES